MNVTKVLPRPQSDPHSGTLFTGIDPLINGMREQRLYSTKT